MRGMDQTKGNETLDSANSVRATLTRTLELNKTNALQVMIHSIEFFVPKKYQSTLSSIEIASWTL